jgi:hypothetical protein
LSKKQPDNSGKKQPGKSGLGQKQNRANRVVTLQSLLVDLLDLCGVHACLQSLRKKAKAHLCIEMKYRFRHLLLFYSSVGWNTY